MGPRRSSGHRLAKHRVLLSLATILAARSATAQTAEEMATRRVMLEQAEQAQQAGNHAAALQSAQDAGAIHMTPSLRLFIAEEELALSHMSAALGDADLCIAETERDTAATNRTSILARCHEIEASARAHSGTLTVRVADPHLAGLHVTVAGATLSPTLLGRPTLVAPGDLAVDATATGRAPFHAQIHVTAGQNAEVTVALADANNAQPANAPRAETAQPSSTAPIAHTEPSQPAPEPTPEAQTAAPPHSGSHLTPPRIAAVGAAILGVVALGVGVGLYVDVLGAWDRCASGCTSAQEPRGENAAAVGLVWGGAAVAVLGAAAFFLLPVPHETPAHARIWVDPRGAAGIAGVF